MLNKSNNLVRPVLVLVDVQKGIDDSYWGEERNNPDAELYITELLSFWREHHLPTVHVQHCSKESASPFRPNQVGHDFKEEIKPLQNEFIIQKEETSAFIRTNLEEYLRSQGYGSLVITGFVTNNSVEATARMAGNLGFDTTVVSDATATFAKEDLTAKLHSAETIHNISLANLQGEYASILSTKEILDSLKNTLGNT